VLTETVQETALPETGKLAGALHGVQGVHRHAISAYAKKKVLCGIDGSDGSIRSHGQDAGGAVAQQRNEPGALLLLLFVATKRKGCVVCARPAGATTKSSQQMFRERGNNAGRETQEERNLMKKRGKAETKIKLIK